MVTCPPAHTASLQSVSAVCRIRACFDNAPLFRAAAGACSCARQPASPPTATHGHRAKSEAACVRRGERAGARRLLMDPRASRLGTRYSTLDARRRGTGHPAALHHPAPSVRTASFGGPCHATAWWQFPRPIALLGPTVETHGPPPILSDPAYSSPALSLFLPPRTLALRSPTHLLSLASQYP
jgi:hypothetical protein